MAKLLKRKTAPEPELELEPKPKPKPRARLENGDRDRHAEMQEYAARQNEKGHRQVKLWVPRSCIPWMHRLADDMRRLAELGIDPLTAHERLPAVANKLPDVLFIRVASKGGAEA